MGVHHSWLLLCLVGVVLIRNDMSQNVVEKYRMEGDAAPV